ncbi:acyl-CoA thioesterase [Prochlorothrix hollandica]|uniref:Uncharacterized protein n=1 Tax=Prochlorothrix hollandica PCC 9006 = CALU 1027 TaxID=317619 RepID=A0A0M2PQ39_PROHO|nr:thioesterase family protein [Prochlorothrix hollandica]KKI98349.1 hypothetical protein PROH_19515 [Prochlorothrix hollandica PCC 9006 = CALU 1027]
MIHWYDYPVQVYPHHTDYAGVVWHGTYVQWLEQLRVQYLNHHGLSYPDLVAAGCELPVVAMALQYRRSLRHGQRAVLRGRILPPQGVRLLWEYELRSTTAPDSVLYLTAQVTLAPVNPTTGKVLRRLPPLFQAILTQATDPDRAEPAQIKDPKP